MTPSAARRARRWHAEPFTSGDSYWTGGHVNGAAVRATFTPPDKWRWRVTVWSKLDADVSLRNRFLTRATAQAAAERWLSTREAAKPRKSSLPSRLPKKDRKGRR